MSGEYMQSIDRALMAVREAQEHAQEGHTWELRKIEDQLVDMMDDEIYVQLVHEVVPEG